MRSYLASQVSQQEYSRLHLSRSQQGAYRQTPPCWGLTAFSHAIIIPLNPTSQGKVTTQKITVSTVNYTRMLCSYTATKTNVR